MHKHNFGQTLKSQSAEVTVNIRSRSLKSNSLQTNYMYLCKFGAEKKTLVQKTELRKSSIYSFFRMMTLK